MLIACLGWGSLFWNPRHLPVRGTWFADGPFLPIEFARQSKDHRITLVIVPESPLVRSLWTVLFLTDLDKAREALREREGIFKKNLDIHIGVYIHGSHSAKNEIEARIDSWMKPLMLDAVIWTNLPPKFNGMDNKISTADEVVEYLSTLEYSGRKNAEHYVRMAPRQIDTDYRRYIEAKLHWTPYDKA